MMVNEDGSVGPVSDPSGTSTAEPSVAGLPMAARRCKPLARDPPSQTMPNNQSSTNDIRWPSIPGTTLTSTSITP